MSTRVIESFDCENNDTINLNFRCAINLSTNRQKREYIRRLRYINFLQQNVKFLFNHNNINNSTKSEQKKRRKKIVK